MGHFPCDTHRCYRRFASCRARKIFEGAAEITYDYGKCHSILDESDIMEKFIYKTKQEMGAAAAAAAAQAINKAIEDKGRANIILATGTSQLEMLKNLAEADLDEYIDMGSDHPASFRKFLKERFVDRVPGLKAVHFVNGDAEDPQEECRRVSSLIAEHPIDAAMVGIGENGHLAFNDPPADFDTEQAYLVVELDEKCRKQQLGEGWFETLEQVPRQAISMSIRQIIKSVCLIVTVPDERKTAAVKNALEGKVTPTCPASILQQHGNCKIFMDAEAASLLNP